MKNCAKCKQLKKDNDFYPFELVKNSGWCKECQKRSKQEAKSQQKYYEKNKENLLEYGRRYNVSYRKINKQAVNNYQKQYNITRRKSDELFKLRHTVSSIINFHIKKNGKSKNNNSILDYLRYSIEELKEHLERQFEPWMTWQNYGRYNSKTWNDSDQTTWVWNIDHIIPQSKLPYGSMDDDNFKKCWNLNNLRPLSAKSNIFKSDNLEESND